MSSAEKNTLKSGVALWVLAAASVAVNFGSPAFAQDVAQAPAPATNARTYNLNIPAQPLAQSIAALSAQTGLQIQAGSAVTSTPRQAPAIRGTFTAEQALSRMLSGTGISYQFASASTVSLEAAQAPGAAGASTLPPLRVQGGIAPGANPYADPQAPYKADRLASTKFTEPVLDTPRTVTILTKEVLDDKNATSLREVARSTAGITLGTGEGGNAFGDRFFIRGFDVRNDIFIDGVRDVGVSVRETFNAEQVEILRGPASSLAGRGTSGGAINVVTKQAGDANFYSAEGTVGTDQTRRATFDVNQVVNDKLSVRFNGMGQAANVAGRDITSDNRWGLAVAATLKPSDTVTLKAALSHTYLWGIPDFGVPYNQSAKAPVTETGVPRNTFYGYANRDFYRSTQDLASLDAEWNPADWVTLENKFRAGYKLTDYVGTIPENPANAGATAAFSQTFARFSGFTQQNAQSRYQPVWTLVDQPQATFKFDTGSVRHTAVVGLEFSRERTSIDSYVGLTSETTTGAAAFTAAGAPIVSVFSPPNFFNNAPNIYLTQNPLQYAIDSKSAYAIETANFNDFVILTAGIRVDDFNVSSQQFVNAQFGTAFQSQENTIVSYNAGITVKPLPNGSVYAAFATAARPVGSEVDGNSNQYGGLASTQPSAQLFGPETSTAFEVGTKWEFFDRHLLASAALFQTDVNNARETTPAGVTGVTAGTITAGAAYRIQGIDLQAAGKITDKWSVLAGLVLMKTQVTSSINPFNVGLNLANVANESFSLLSKYRAMDWLELGGQAVYRSQLMGGTGNGSAAAANGGSALPIGPNPTILPSYWRFDAFAEAKVSDQAKVKFLVQNVFDKTYYDGLYQSAVPFVAVAPGRSFQLVGTLKF